MEQNVMKPGHLLLTYNGISEKKKCPMQFEFWGRKLPHFVAEFGQSHQHGAQKIAGRVN